MIKQVYDRSSLALGDDYYSGKISAYFDAYGGSYDFCRFYRAEDESGRAVGSILIYNANAVICGEWCCELEDFLRITSPESIECPVNISGNISLEGYAQKKRTVFKLRSVCGTDKIRKGLQNPVPLGNMFNILDRCFDGLCFDLWYTDMSHRIRHGISRAYLFRSDACAAVDLICGEKGYISSVGVIPESRGNGYGKMLLSCIAEDLERENICGYLMAEEHSADYYRKLGFEECDCDIMHERSYPFT